ncbi:lytic transglycosylase domain-containing protein [Candidatus Pelagibacter ubique]|jgi:soluble lytic murein transglycosylase|nr:lytic transglycosylase domain-containing protein [Candidatus Pelagibacter ubique]MDB3944220.1 lytic transglycosylase domain-containing protein [Candidatus Pelagibacter ubique]MDC6474681.1 lytic transglycosylase domain-containing protein [Candidatus Pelagibacter ubique]
MPRKIIFFIRSLLLSLVIIGNVFAAEISIIPVKKPILNEEVKREKISQGILKPKPKPSQKKEEIEIITVKKNKKEINFLIPKSKPLIVKNEKSVVQKSSKYYSQKDYDIAKKSIQSMEKGQWTTALKNSKNAKDKSIYNFIQWRHLLTTGNQATFYDYMTFIQNNKHYPRISRIKYLAEQKLSTDKISPKKIINWFGVDEPLSGYGMLVLGESFIQTGDNEKGIALIKRGWITAELSRASMKSLSKKYRKYLDSKDYINRADYLAWENKYWDLKRMLPYLPKDYQLLYTARQILMSKSYGVDQAIKNVPQKFKNDAGLNHDRLKWRRKRGRIDSSLEILSSIKNNKDYLVRPDKWWVERAIMSRALIYKNKYETAYKVASQHSLDKGSEFAEAEWLSGWIALSFLNDPILAVDHFNNFYQNVSYPISLARGAYWLGRSYEKIGDKRQSEDWYREATKYLTTYYGQLAFLKINPSQNFELEEQADVEDDYRKYFYNKELVKITHLLNELNKDKYTKNILRHLANDNIASGSEILAAELATNISRYDFAIQVSKLASYEKRFHNTFNYPIISVPQYVNGRKIPETAFILSLIRQESEFDMRANSHVGAQGLMQIMPYTAKLVAKQAKLPYSKSRLTSDPEYNINLGSHYIAGLILQYDGAYPFATAAYNAGPKRVKHWKKINKDPQKKQIDFVDWVELIPFKETRNYVQRVMENYNVYRYILEKKPIKMKDFFKDQPLF